jgi:uncharacterized protein (DUF1330 family)
MAAYIIADVRVTDPVAYEEYRRQVSSTLEQYGGRFLARGGAAYPLEGGWEPGRIVVLEFEGVERARAWYGSAEYAPLLRIRQAASEGRFILVEGVPT